MVNKKEHTPNNAENVYLQRKYTIQCKKNTHWKDGCGDQCIIRLSTYNFLSKSKETKINKVSLTDVLPWNKLHQY